MLGRRHLLALGGSGVAAGLSGCLSSGLLASHPEVREESGQTVERAIYTPLTDKTADPAFTTLVVGDGGGFHLGEKKPHQVWVRNGTGESRDVLVEIGASSDADPWFRRTYEFAPDGQLVVELRTPREYAVSVEIADAAETVEVAESRFDCNDSAHEVVVRDGEIETTGATTDMGCPTF